MTLPAARDLSRIRHPRRARSRPGLFDTPLLGALPEEQRAGARRGRSRSRQRLGRPTSTRRSRCQIVENTMLNGETIRLDGALRMPPK